VSGILAALVLFLVATVLAALWRVAAGPTPADRLLAPQLFGTTGIAALLVAAEWLGSPALRDVALVLALLAFATTTAFALRAWGTGAGGECEP
jgi:multicomponent Na+:H+ antiporter subunit F